MRWSLPFLFWSCTAIVLFFVYRRDISALWLEPVLKRPVLIVESDDWGAGPLAQVDALNDIAGILRKFQDKDRRHPVFTLALILATANGREKERESAYTPILLRDERFSGLRHAIEQGYCKKVFSLQLHGKEHFWPTTLQQASSTEPSLAIWLQRSPEAGTEELPASLQSRWIDAKQLPSRPLPQEAIVEAVTDEVEEFDRCFGFRPSVVVPPTFVWNQEVERAWRVSGVHVVVTPGRRFESRDGSGQPTTDGPAIRNGERSPSGVLYVVRDDYFEPEKGHTAERALAALASKTRLGRPTLLETHRSNFLDPAGRRHALAEIRRLFERALQTYPDLAFISTERLALIMEQNEPDWIEQRVFLRLHSYIERLWTLPRMRKLLWLTTLMLPVGFLWLLSDGFKHRK